MDKIRALDLLVKSDKIVVIATHDPVLALSAHRRLVFENGAVRHVIARSDAEERLRARLEAMEEEYSGIRTRLRRGGPAGIGRPPRPGGAVSRAADAPGACRSPRACPWPG